jgi:16S rRNA (uracil1498-N3)-methyltransferase
MRHTFRYLLAGVPSPGDEVALSAEDSHHLARVVRRGVGDEIELIDPDGSRWTAAVVAPGPPARLRVISGPGPDPAVAPIALYLGLAEWGRVDVAVEKAVELGAGELALMVSERAGRVPQADAWARRRERLERVAGAAARQCGRAPLARVRGLVPFAEVIAEIPAGEGFLIDPRGDAPLLDALRARARPDMRIALVVGPHAGFSEAEVALARAGGMPVCSMGPTILRTETAAIAALAVAAASVGSA